MDLPAVGKQGYCRVKHHFKGELENKLRRKGKDNDGVEAQSMPLLLSVSQPTLACTVLMFSVGHFIGFH